MITPIINTQPQFKAKMYSCDISVLTNEAKRSTNPKKAEQELFTMLKLLDNIPGQTATLLYDTRNKAGKYNLILDKKNTYTSKTNFTDTLKRALNLKNNNSLNLDKNLSDKQLSKASFIRLAIDA